MKKLFCILTMAVFFISCGGHRNAPKDLISEDKLASILTEIHIADGLIGEQTSLKDKKTKEKYYNSIFFKYKITRKQFDESMAYYTRNINVLNKIYFKVLENLSKLQAETEKMPHPAGEETE